MSEFSHSTLLTDSSLLRGHLISINIASFVLSNWLHKCNGFNELKLVSPSQQIIYIFAKAKLLWTSRYNITCDPSIQPYVHALIILHHP